MIRQYRFHECAILDFEDAQVQRYLASLKAEHNGQLIGQKICLG
jgi:hypothetical protein